MTDKFKMTQRGYEKLVADLDHLKNVRREEIREYMGKAIADGDLRESAAYDEARMLQSENEAKILELEDRLSRVEIVDPDQNAANSVVGLGATIVIKDQHGKEMTLEIVGSYEVSVSGPVKRISEDSPMGKLLKDRKKGESVSFETPKGKTEYTVMEIRY